MQDAQAVNKLGRRAAWIPVILAIIGVLVYHFVPVTKEAEHTAVIIATKRILDGANSYKEYWILNNKPQQATVKGKDVHFSRKGWVLPLRGEQTDCLYWLELLYPAITVMGGDTPVATEVLTEDDFICQMQYKQHHTIELKLKQGQFSVSAKIMLDH